MISKEAKRIRECKIGEDDMIERKGVKKIVKEIRKRHRESVCKDK